MTSLLDRLKQRAEPLKRDTLALYLACRDPRTPWYAKVLAGIIVAYALSPIDIVPDFVPILGYLDDLLIVPGGLMLSTRLIPATVMAESRERAARMAERPTSRSAAVVIAGIWLGAIALTIYLLGQLLGLP